MSLLEKIEVLLRSLLRIGADAFSLLLHLKVDIYSNLIEDRSYYRCQLTFQPCKGPQCPWFSSTCEFRKFVDKAVSLTTLLRLARKQFDFWLMEKDVWFKPLTGTSLRESKKEVEVEVHRSGEFPFDRPFLKYSEIMEMIKASKGGDTTRPSYWDGTRAKYALGNNFYWRRCAADDWLWSWFSNFIREIGTEPTDEEIKLKYELDKLVYSVSKEFTNEEAILDKDKITPEVLSRIDRLWKSIRWIDYKLNISPSELLDTT